MALRPVTTQSATSFWPSFSDAEASVKTAPARGLPASSTLLQTTCPGSAVLIIVHCIHSPMARSRVFEAVSMVDAGVRRSEFGCGVQVTVASYPADLGDDEDSDSTVWPWGR